MANLETCFRDIQTRLLVEHKMLIVCVKEFRVLADYPFNKNGLLIMRCEYRAEADDKIPMNDVSMEPIQNHLKEDSLLVNILNYNVFTDTNNYIVTMLLNLKYIRDEGLSNEKENKNPEG